MPIEEKIHVHFLHAKETLAFAESCTGGLLSYQITKQSGASEYFLGSFVTYSNEWKESILGVSKDVLKFYGAVSEPVAKAMAEGAFKKSHATWVASLTGVMGPTGSKEIGTVYYAIYHLGKNVSSGLLPKKEGLEREALMKETAKTLLEYLWNLIQNQAKLSS